MSIADNSERLVTMLLLIYKKDDETIRKAIEFIEKTDFETVAKNAVEAVFRDL